MARLAPDFDRLIWPLHTARLLLRPLEVADAPAAHRYRRDPEVTRYLSHGPLTLSGVTERHEDRVRRRQPGEPDPLLGLAIEDSSGLVGDCMMRFDAPDGCWIGYALAPEVHGRGYATEMAGALVDLANEMGVGVLLAKARTANVASRRVLEKAGFVRIKAEAESDSVVFGLRLAGR